MNIFTDKKLLAKPTKLIKHVEHCIEYKPASINDPLWAVCEMLYVQNSLPLHTFLKGTWKVRMAVGALPSLHIFNHVKVINGEYGHNEIGDHVKTGNFQIFPNITKGGTTFRYYAPYKGITDNVVMLSKDVMIGQFCYNNAVIGYFFMVRV